MTEEVLTRGERTRQAIIDASYSLFVVQGFHATSMRQIASRAGLALGGIYNHFNGKEDIFRVIMLEKHPYKQIIPLVVSAQGETIEALVHNAARAMVDELGHHPEFVNLMLIEIVEFKAQHIPEIFKLLFPEVLSIGQRLENTEGRLRPIPLPLLLRAFIGLFFSYYMTELLIAEMMPVEMKAQALETFVDIFLHGILEKEA